MRLKNVFKKPPPGATFDAGLHRDYLEDLLNSVFIGFFMVGIFLDLMIFEIMYLIFLFSAAKYAIEHKTLTTVRAPKDSIYRVGQSKSEDEDLSPKTT